ncbi:MAG: glucosaminidase domain-containing protein [Opitutaceae bacterium]|jgi:Bax protein
MFPPSQEDESVKEFHHPVVWASEPRPSRAKEIARSWWRPVVIATAVTVMTGALMHLHSGCEALPDFSEITDPGERKAAFIAHLVPLVREANHELEAPRARLLAIDAGIEAGWPTGSMQRNFVRVSAERRGIAVGPVIDRAVLAELLQCVDSVPASLVIAQAAIESGWGTSRFTREGNNLFGMRTYAPGAGLVPRKREAGENFGVSTYPTVCDSIRGYIQNLNTDPCYRELRRIRAELRAEHKPVTGEALADGLEAYSENGSDYVSFVRTIIADNDLGRFDLR